MPAVARDRVDVWGGVGGGVEEGVGEGVEDP